MAVYDANGNQLSAVYDANGNDLNTAYDVEGNVIFTKGSGEKHKLLSYTDFYPDDATNEYSTTYNTFRMYTDEFLALMYDDYVTNPPTGVRVTKKSLGKDSTGAFDIWEYDFRPATAERTIKLVSGEHAYECTAQFGLAHFIYHVYRVQDNDAFEYIRKYVRVKVVPIFNPWGRNQYPRAYGVLGGINPERNFNYADLWENFSYSHDGGTAGDYWNKKGDYPFQTAETRTWAKWCMEDQEKTDFLINCHTSENDSHRDVWIDYMTQTAAAEAILEAFERNKTIFRTKYNRTPRTEITGTSYPNETGYGMHGAWNMFCVHHTGLTLEQSPRNTIFGEGYSNCAGAINNYASVLATNVLELLLDKYQSVYDSLHPNNTIPITGLSGQDVTMSSSDYSTTVALTMTPSNTTQFTFDWVSSNPSVCEVWGCTEQAVIVKRGTGVAQITVTNRKNPSIRTSFIVRISS